MPEVKTIDGRDLSPPEPLELAMAALDTLSADDELVMLLYCRPQPLFNILKQNGFKWVETVQDDGTHEIRIRKA